MNILLILLIVSLLVSAVGWKYFIYFFSLGYGYGIAALALTLVIIYHNFLTPATIALCAALFIFGCRLGTYLLLREKRATAYRKILYADTKKKPLFVIITVWLFCALLYVAQVSPVAFRLANTADGMVVNPRWAWIGAGLIVLGTTVEALADKQKSAAKKVNPKRFVDTGLYRIVRCPNYLGELIIWTGALVSGIWSGFGTFEWTIVGIGYAGIVFVMFSGARRLELRQDEVYGNDPEYQAYIKKTPIIIPLIPLYSVKKHKWLVA